jgi:DNA-directed RNA polymerase sigma subunit (sigma70/sigma32)
MTLREIAERERLTFARIQQIEKSALKKLSKRSGNLKDFLIE